MRSTWLALLPVAVPLAAMAQAQQARSPYAGQEVRSIKALSDDEIRGLREGRGIGFAKAAELNHYPGPRHTLDLADSLALTPDQRRRLRSIYDGMHAAVVPLGEEMLAVEARLDSLFAHRSIDTLELERLTRESARIAGALRSAHLAAHLATRRVLSPAQVMRYDRLRGYGGQSDEHAHHEHE